MKAYLARRLNCWSP